MYNPVYLVATPLALAFASMILTGSKKFLAIVGALSNVLIAIFVSHGSTVIGGFRIPYGINIYVDNYAAFALVLINGLFLAALLMSPDLIGKYAPILLTALAGLNGMLITGDLFNLFVFMEIAAISAYVLTNTSKKPIQSFNYVILGAIGSSLYLLGIIIFYSMTGTLNMADLSIRMAGLTSVQKYLPITLIFMGLAVEAKLLPMSGWVKGIYSNANRLVGSLLASVFAGTILFVFGRLFTVVIAADSVLVNLMMVIGIITFIFGEFAAYKQVKIRKILLFSSIGQAGLIVTLFLSGLVFPAVLQIANNIISKLIMFSTAGAMQEAHATDDYTALKGAFYKNKLLGLSFTFAALSLMGLPLFFGFYAKLNVLYSVFASGNYYLPALILLLTIIEGAYFIRMLVTLWAPGKEGYESKAEDAVKEVRLMPVFSVVISLALALSITVSGLMPNLVNDLISPDGRLLGEQIQPFYISEMRGGN